jgi:hypothetical protein
MCHARATIAAERLAHPLLGAAGIMSVVNPSLDDRAPTSPAIPMIAEQVVIISGTHSRGH